jgi:hypothetical protein
VNLFEQQAVNRRKSRLLIAGFLLFFAWLGFGGDYLAWQYTSGAEPGAYRHQLPWFGFVLAAIGVLVLAAALVRSVATGVPLLSGAAVVGLVAGLGGVQLVFLGVLGEYLGAILDEVKGRPHYVVEERINLETQDGGSRSSGPR